MYAPEATVNRIENYQVVEKLDLKLPEQIDNVLVCPNSNCISHNEPVASSFRIKKRENNVALACKFCEKEFDRDAVINNQ
ncbi:Aspartate carbamoyltransferase regulatory chain [Providencia rustigianii]|nr:Aspartate carbamoyltransferase regulatory chain [Providencia rustigianii]